MIKHVKDINFEDEFIRITPNMTVLEVAQALVSHRSEIDAELVGETIVTPILVAYVMEGQTPVGVIDKDVLIEAVVVNGLNPVETRASDIMKPLVSFNAKNPVFEVVNAIIEQGLLTVGDFGRGKINRGYFRF